MTLRDNCYTTSGTENDVFVGLRFVDGKISIVFPLGYSIPNDDKELKKSILSLIKTIALTKTIDKSNSIIDDSFTDTFSIPIFAYFSLLMNFINYGLYFSKEKIYTENNGNKINWKRTIQRSKSVIYNDNLFFINPYYERTKNKDNIVTEIQKYCLKVSLDYFSWFFGKLNVSRSIFSDKDTDYMLKILKKELSISFSQYKIDLINTMIDVITGLDTIKHNKKAFTFGTNNYHIVWEKMINDLYGTERLDEYYPSAKWHLIDKRNEKASNLRPDCIHFDKVNNKFYVMDAKYYRYCVDPVISKLPGSDSVQKQITYASYIHLNKKINGNKIDGNQIFNAFLLPYNSKLNGMDSDEMVLYYGYADCDWIINDDASNNYPFYKVALIFLDTKHIIDSWFEKNSQDIDLIKTCIEKVMV